MTDKEAEKSKCLCPYCDAELEKNMGLCSVCKVNITYCKECGRPMTSNSGRCPGCGTIC